MARQNNPNMGSPTSSYTTVYDANRQLMNEYDFPTPPGYRFVPTDVELVTSYLKPKILDKPLPAGCIIHDVNIYKSNPEQLSEKYKLKGEKVMYFFTPRDRKYPRGSRPSRTAVDGFWKASGADVPIGNREKPIGYRKALVFHEGDSRESTKTSWIMHEYTTQKSTPCTSRALKPKMLDEWVLCKMYKNVQDIDNQPPPNIVPHGENQPPPNIVPHGENQPLPHGELPDSVQKPQSNLSLVNGYNTNDFSMSNCNGQINGYDLLNGSQILPPAMTNTNDSTKSNCNGQITGSDCGDHKYSQDLSTGLVHDSAAESLFMDVEMPEYENLEMTEMQDFPGVPANVTELEVPLPDFYFPFGDNEEDDAFVNSFLDYPELLDSAPGDKAQQVP